MDEIKITENHLSNDNYLEERKDMAAAFRWAERSNLHEAVANHFRLAVNAEGTQFLMNPNMFIFYNCNVRTKIHNDYYIGYVFEDISQL